MIFDEELSKLAKIQANLARVHEHNGLFLKTLNNIQILIKNHMVILSQLLSDTESLHTLSCDAVDVYKQAEELAETLKIH